MKKLTADMVMAWWDAGGPKEREEFLDALVKKIGKDEMYLMMVEVAGGEEELAELARYVHHRSGLS